MHAIDGLFRACARAGLGVVLASLMCIAETSPATRSWPTAPPRIRVVGIDGVSQEGMWGGMTANDLAIRTEAGDARISADDLTLVIFVDAATATRSSARTPGETICMLADGGILHGVLAEHDDGGIRLARSSLGDLSLRLADLAALRLDAGTDNAKAQAEMDRWLARRPAGHDVLVVVRDGSVTAVRAAVLAVGPDGGRFSYADRTLTFRRDTVYGIVFGGAAAAPAAPRFALTLGDGSRIAAAITRADEQTIHLMLSQRYPAAVRVDQVRQIDVRSERVTFASDMQPVEAVFEPYLDTPWPHRRDRSVANRPIRLGGVEYAKGLGVHSRSDIAFALDGKYTRFAATIGIDDFVRPRGHVVFRVLADGREVFRSGPVTGRDEPRAVLVDVTGARQVRLIVEFGEEFDVADHADWAHARFIR